MPRRRTGGAVSCAAMGAFSDTSPPRKRRPLAFHRTPGVCGAIVLLVMGAICVLTLPYTLGSSDPNQTDAPRRYEATNTNAALQPPFWAASQPTQSTSETPSYWLGSDRLGRSVLIRCLAGGGISLGIGLAAAFISVVVGTIYGTIAGLAGARTDALMMRAVDVLYGLPYILLVVLLAVAVDGLVQRAGTDLAPAVRRIINVVTLLVAIGSVSWLTMARVIRGQVLSLKNQPFMEACEAIGISKTRAVVRHLLPNLIGPIIVYATLTVPQAILSESFLSFLGIGVKEPLPSWGNLAADGLNEINVVHSRWWLLFWPCVLLALTLLSLNFIGESLRERFDPKRRTTPLDTPPPQ